MSTPHKSIRLTEDLITRIEAIAKVDGGTFSDVLRRVIRRGVVVVEQEIAPAEVPRRKVLSRGVE